MPKFSKKARQHAAYSKADKERQIKAKASRSGPVEISYLPGFEPPELPKAIESRTKFPFVATINGRRAIVWPDWIEYEEVDEYA